MITYKGKYKEAELILVNFSKRLNNNADNDDTDIIEKYKYFLSRDGFSIHDTYTHTYNQSKVDNFNTDHVFSFGKTLLHIAVKHKCEKVVNALLKGGADANIQDKLGKTSLHVVATSSENSLKLGKLLLENGADPNLKDVFGHSPLYYALEYKNLEIAKLLVDNGADQSCIHKPKSLKIGILTGLLFALVTPLILIYFTKLTAPVMIIATVSSALIIGGIAYGAAYMWLEHLLTSKLSEVDNCNNLVSSVERQIT